MKNKIMVLAVLCSVSLCGCGSKKEINEPLMVNIDKEVTQEEQPTEEPINIISEQPTEDDLDFSNDVVIQISEGDTFNKKEQQEERNTDNSEISNSKSDEEIELHNRLLKSSLPKNFSASKVVDGTEEFYYEYNSNTNERYTRFLRNDEQVQIYVSDKSSIFIQDKDIRVNDVIFEKVCEDDIRNLFDFRIQSIDNIRTRGVLYDLDSTFYFEGTSHTGTITVGDGYIIQNIKYDENNTTITIKVKTLLKMSKDSNSFGQLDTVSKEEFETKVKSAISGNEYSDVENQTENQNMSTTPDDVTEQNNTSETSTQGDVTNTVEQSEKTLLIGCGSSEDLIKIVPILNSYGKYSISDGNSSDAMSVENLNVYECTFSSISDLDISVIINKLNEKGYDAKVK